MTLMRSLFGSWSVVKCAVGPGGLMCNPKEFQNGFGRDFLCTLVPCWSTVDVGGVLLHTATKTLRLKSQEDTSRSNLRHHQDEQLAKDLLGNPVSFTSWRMLVSQGLRTTT